MDFQQVSVFVIDVHPLVIKRTFASCPPYVCL